MSEEPRTTLGMREWMTSEAFGRGHPNMYIAYGVFVGKVREDEVDTQEKTDAFHNTDRYRGLKYEVLKSCCNEDGTPCVPGGVPGKSLRVLDLERQLRKAQTDGWTNAIWGVGWSDRGEDMVAIKGPYQGCEMHVDDFERLLSALCNVQKVRG
jgi:hypothetical protein